MKVNRKFNMNVLLFMGFIYCFFCLNLIFTSGQTESVREKRELKKMPEFSIHSLFKGTYLRELEEYVSDHFMFRDKLLTLNGYVQKAKGISTGGSVELVLQPVAGNSSASPVGDGTGEGLPNEPVVTEGYLIARDRAVLLYRYNQEVSEKYAGTLSLIQSKISPDTKVFSMLVPSSVEYYIDEKYRKMTGNQSAAIEHVYKSFNEEITPIPVHTELQAHKEEYIYFRTDHHWTALGAYYGYNAFMKAAGQEPLPLGDFKKRSFDGFLGTAYTKTLNPALQHNPDTVDVYIPRIDFSFRATSGETGELVKRNVLELYYRDMESAKYNLFLGGDYGFGHIQTKSKSNQKLLLIKDSYANAMVPFLIPHYQDIYMIDPRFFKDNLIRKIEELDVDHILFVNNTIVTTYEGISRMLLEKLEL